jgi:hypothetical protein
MSSDNIGQQEIAESHPSGVQGKYCKEEDYIVLQINFTVG